MEHFLANGAKFSYVQKAIKDSPVVVWGHGWGQDHRAFLSLVAGVEKNGRHIVLDFPGFGKSSEPPESWGTADYSDAVASWLRRQDFGKIIWVGHSFGGRVGIQLAARHPDLVDGMFLIAAAGLKPKRPLYKRISMKGRVLTFKFLKNFVPAALDNDRLMKKFGSSDYKNAGPLRKLFVRVVNEDLKDEAARITCPVKLVYGTLDTEARPEMGERLQKLIPNAELVLLPGEDHYTVLNGGHHQVASLLNRFIKDPHVS